jgi:hypothetical protein
MELHAHIHHASNYRLSVVIITNNFKNRLVTYCVSVLLKKCVPAAQGTAQQSNDLFFIVELFLS